MKVRTVWKFPRRAGKRGLSSGQLEGVTSYLAIMLECGLDLIQALVVLTKSGEMASRECARHLARDIESGMKFSQAMSRQPETFPSTYRRVVETAEEAGKLSMTLTRLSITLERQARTSKRLKSTLVYPACLLFCSVLLVSVMLYFVFPLLLKVTQDAGVEPPPLTRLLILVASKKLALILLVGGWLGGAGLRYFWKHPRWGPHLQRFLEEKTPPGRFLARIYLLGAVRQLAMMLESGVDLLKSILYAGKVGEGSLLVREAFQSVYERVKLGESLATSMARYPVFPQTLTGLVAVADEVGDVHLVLYRFCDLYEDHLNNHLDAIAALLEPVLMASMGLVVGFILVAAFLPIYNLVSL